MPNALFRVITKGARLAAGALCILGLAGCASLVPQTMALREAWPDGVPQRVELEAVPFFPQTEYQCGPAALATTLAHSGVRVTPEELVSQVYLPSRQGSLQADMLAAPRRHDRVSYPLAPRLDDLLREVAAGNPVIVLQDLGLGPSIQWHYAVVIGFDYAAGELWLRSGETRRLATPFTVFEYTWRKSGYWAMVTLPTDRIPATAREADFLVAVAAMARVAGDDAAVSAYASFLDRWPGNAAAGVALANLHHEKGRFAQAEDVLRRAASHSPDAVPVLNNLAQTVSDLGRHAEALAIIERAASLGGPFAENVRQTRHLIRERLTGSRSSP